MSRLAKRPIELAKNVEVKALGEKVEIKGPKGTLVVEIFPGIKVVQEGSSLMVEVSDPSSKGAVFLGLCRAKIANAIKGVVEGYQKKLELQGVGYKAAMKGQVVELALGFSHPVNLPIPEGLQVAIEKATLITITGIDKQLLGQFAASIREIKPPEPYKGKGVRYQGEYVRRKAGKTAKK